MRMQPQTKFIRMQPQTWERELETKFGRVSQALSELADTMPSRSAQSNAALVASREFERVGEDIFTPDGNAILSEIHRSTNTISRIADALEIDANEDAERIFKARGYNSKTNYMTRVKMAVRLLREFARMCSITAVKVPVRANRARKKKMVAVTIDRKRRTKFRKKVGSSGGTLLDRAVKMVR